MEPKTLFYAAIGAPATIARRTIDTATTRYQHLTEKRGTYEKMANERIATWATEGEKVLERLSETDIVDEVAGKVDIDQVRTQVSKLRDQLEDMLGFWRTSFAPEVDVDVEIDVEARTAPKKTG